MTKQQLPEEHYYLGNGQEIPNPRTGTMTKDREATPMEQLKQDLLGACARGYTHDENSSKELDSDLIKAIVEEIMKLVKASAN